MRRAPVLVGILIAMGAHACTRFGASDNSDAGIDAGIVDARVIVDAGDARTTVDADAGPISSCVAPACDSFENGNVSDGWMKLVVGNDAGIGAGPGHDSNRSFHSEVGADDGQNNRNAQLVKTFTQVSSLRCSFWVRVLRANPDSDLLRVDYTGASATNGVWLDSNVGKTTINRIQHQLADLADWTRVSFTFADATFRLVYGDIEVTTEPLAEAAPWAMNVAFGIFTNATDGAAIEYDDIACDAL